MRSDHGLSRYGWTSPEPTLAHAYLLPAIKRLLPRGAQLSILDAGCGNGYVAGQLSALGHRVTGVDLSEDGISVARAAYPQIRFDVASVYDDLLQLTGQVDVVVSSEVIEHLYYPATFLKNLWNVVRVGGCVILTTPYHGYFKNMALSLLNLWDKHHAVDHEGGHIKFFSQTALARMLRSCGFGSIVYSNAGRVPWLWKSMVCRAEKP